MKIFQINDCDWWIGESLEQCVQDYRDNIDDDPSYTEDARELTNEELDSLKFSLSTKTILTSIDATDHEMRDFVSH